MTADQKNLGQNSSHRNEACSTRQPP